MLKLSRPLPDWICQVKTYFWWGTNPCPKRPSTRSSSGWCGPRPRTRRRRTSWTCPGPSGTIGSLQPGFDSHQHPIFCFYSETHFAPNSLIFTHIYRKELRECSLVSQNFDLPWFVRHPGPIQGGCHIRGNNDFKGVERRCTEASVASYPIPNLFLPPPLWRRQNFKRVRTHICIPGCVRTHTHSSMHISPPPNRSNDRVFFYKSSETDFFCLLCWYFCSFVRPPISGNRGKAEKVNKAVCVWSVKIWRRCILAALPHAHNITTHARRPNDKRKTGVFCKGACHHWPMCIRLSSYSVPRRASCFRLVRNDVSLQ